jgi:hypothetical protein
MSAYKKLNKQDAFITPYTAHKEWAFNSHDFTESGIDIFHAISGSDFFEPAQEATTGFISTQYKRLSYESVRHLYYSLQETGTAGSGSFVNYEQTTLYASSSRELPISASILSIPRSIIGNRIKPGTLTIVEGDDQNYVTPEFVSQSYVEYRELAFNAFDDGEGNLLQYSGSGTKKVGDVIYPHGLVVFTDEDFINTTTQGTVLYTLSLKNDVDIFTHQYRCRVRESDMNHTYNPTALSGSDGLKAANVTGSCFKPYVTTVGLYNDAHELVAVGKLGQPVPMSETTDTTFVINLDI